MQSVRDPLDGSALSETALPSAVALAETTGARRRVISGEIRLLD
jgi:hypothetical protein